MDDTFLTISSFATGLYKEKGSKFISLLFPIKDEEEAKEIISKTKKQYFDATHHCYAYIIGQNKEVFRMNDDGEPSFSAGKPIYGQLISKKLTNVLLIVVRYFGGIKLGVGGLTSAYKMASCDVIDKATIIEKTLDCIYSINFQYENMNDVMKVLKEFDVKQMNHNFDNENCYLEFRIRKKLSEKIISKLEKIEMIKIQFLFIVC
ncbi:MAG: YigZ family protein [Bacteroidales bacterium]|jgi:uncharacterized YigZ family protein|nr:YigZ family protein [Bacteroidales bacterium]